MKKRGSEKQRHVVAWINKAEWDQVLEHLYSREAALQRNALHRVSAWRARFVHRTPVAVDCTADLVRCQVLDRSGQVSGDDLVLLYGAALVRFVNQITERQQGRAARPLRRLAGNLNIPAWVVDLRHEVTHRKLPSLKWCRKGCKVALGWLQQEYWSRQLGGGASEGWDCQSDGEDEERREEEELLARQKEMETYKAARELLISYEKEQFEACGGGKEPGRCRAPQEELKGAWPPPLADMSWILGEVKQFAVEWSELLIDVLLEDGFLVPTPEQLQTLGCDPPDDDSLAEPRLPLTFLRFWLPLLKMLNSPGFIHQLLEKLFVELKLLNVEPNSHRAFYAAAWISELFICNSNKFEYHFETKMQKKNRMKDRIFVNRIQLRWQQLLAACLDAPCRCTPRLLRLILDDMEHPLPLDTRQKLLQLCSIYTQPAPSEADLHKQPVYTLESLHEKLQHARRRTRRSTANSERSESPDRAEKVELLRGSPWQLCVDKVAWKDFPLGKVPGQSDDPSCLMAENVSTMTVFDQPVELEGGAAAGPAGAPVRTSEGLLWSHGDVNKLKSGLKLF